MADAWHYAYTDFGEGRGRSPQPVLRAVVAVATPGSSTRFSAIIDTGGPITVVATEVLAAGGDPIERGDTMMLRLGGTTSAVSLFDLTLEVRPPAGVAGTAPVSWRGIVARALSGGPLSVSGLRCQWLAIGSDWRNVLQGFMRQRGSAWDQRVYLGKNPVGGKQRNYRRRLIGRLGIKWATVPTRRVRGRQPRSVA